MATVLPNTASPVETKGILGPQDYAIKTLNLLFANGQKMELKKLVFSLDYYEDIYSFVTSGSITLNDAQGFPELLQLTGNEFIEINFGKYKDSVNSTDQIFRVYKMGERNPGKNLNSQRFTLYFCSEELLLSEQTKISKSYSGQKISEIVWDVLLEQMQVDIKKIYNIEETTGVYDFLVPRLKPFEAISWVSTYARPEGTDLVGADMLFFETKDGYNFRSIQSMISSVPYATYKYQLQNVDNLGGLQNKLSSILEYEFTKVYDALSEISNGTFASKLLTIDPLTRSFKSTNFDYSDFQKQVKTLNEGTITNDVINRLGKTISQASDSVLKFMTSNADQLSVPFIKNKQAGVAKDIYVETYVPQRTAQLALANYNVIKLTIPGDPGITAGRTIQLDLPSIKPSTSTRQLDKFYSGKYLVTAVRQMIGVNTFQTVLEIAKDSFPNSPASADNTAFKSSVKA
jgi:hypothetical protein